MAEIIKIKYQKTYKNGTIASTGSYKIPIPNDDKLTHNFFNDLTITNTSSNNILVTPDNDSDRAFIVPSKASLSWSFKDDNMRYSSLELTDLSGSEITANTIYCVLMKKRLEAV